MNMRFLLSLFAASFALLASGVFQISQGDGSAGLSLVVLGLGCCVVLLLVDTRKSTRTNR